MKPRRCLPNIVKSSNDSSRSSSSNESSHVSSTSLAAIPTEVLRILNHLPVQLTFRKLTTKCYQNWALPRLKNSEKSRWQENDKIVKKSTQDLAGASLLFFLLPMVPRASSPVTRVSHSPLTKMRNEAPEEEAAIELLGISAVYRYHHHHHLTNDIQ